MQQRRNRPSPYVSLTADPAVALYYALYRTPLRPRVMRVDTQALERERLIPLTGMNECAAAGLKAAAINLTAPDAEWLHRGALPPAAAARPFPDPVMTDLTPLKVVWPSRRTDKHAFQSQLPRGTRQRCLSWAQEESAPAAAAAAAAAAPAAAAAAPRDPPAKRDAGNIQRQQ